MRGLEKLLSNMPFMRFIFQRWIIEILARCAGSIVGTLARVSRFGIERRVRGFFGSCYFSGTGLKIDRGLQIEGHNALILGNDVTLFGGSHYVAHRSNPLTVGSRTHIGRNSVLAGLGGISIGENCAISSGVKIYSITQNVDSDPSGLIIDNGVIKKQVIIGNDVWIGAGAIVLPGVTIHDHAVVGAGAVVTKDVEPWMVVVGTPAKPIRDRRSDSDSEPGDDKSGQGS